MTMAADSEDADDGRRIEDEPPLEGQLVFKGPVDEDELGAVRRRTDPGRTDEP